jgi:hypothetical protein
MRQVRGYRVPRAESAGGGRNPRRVVAGNGDGRIWSNSEGENKPRGGWTPDDLLGVRVRSWEDPTVVENGAGGPLNQYGGTASSYQDAGRQFNSMRGA